MDKSILKKHFKMKFRKDRLFFVIGIILIILLFNLITKGKFLTLANIEAIITHSIYPTFVAWAMVFIFASGIIDLSCGANILLSCNIGTILAITLGLGYPGLIIGCICTGWLLTMFSLFISQKLSIPSWINGLGMAMVYEGILIALSSYMINVQGGQLPSLGTEMREVGSLPISFIIWIIGAFAASILYNRTKAGISIRAVGSNINVTETMGVKRQKAVLIGGAIGGIFIGIASLLDISYSGIIYATSGLASFTLMFKPLAAWLLAKAFEKQVSQPVGVFISAIFVMSLFNVMTHLGIPTGTGQDILLGCIVIFFGLLSQKNQEGVVK